MKEIYPDVEHTYGHITKNIRTRLKLEKSHANDAFCIAESNYQKRVNPLLFDQVKRNSRSLEKFYDAKYIDTRTGKKVSASELNNGRSTRNKDKNSENLRKYRGAKISKGRRSIKKQRYFYQPNDLCLHGKRHSKPWQIYSALIRIKHSKRLLQAIFYGPTTAA